MTGNRIQGTEDQALLAFLHAQRDAVLSIVAGPGRGGVAPFDRAVGLDAGRAGRPPRSMIMPNTCRTSGHRSCWRRPGGLG